MKITSRTLLILGATVLLLIFAMLLIVVFFSQSTYTHIELEQSEANLQLVADQIRRDAEELGTNARDWAVWDDTYQFMEDRNDHYFATVIQSPSTFEALRVSRLVFFDGTGNVVAAKGYDSRNKTWTQVSDESIHSLKRTLGTLTSARGGKKKQGLILLPEGPSLIGMHTILPTNATGPGRGTLVLLQPLDPAKVSSIQNRLHLPVRIWRLDDPAIRAQGDLSTMPVTSASLSWSQVRNDTAISGFSSMTDIENRPILLLEVITIRSISQLGMGMVVYLVAAFLLIGIIYILFTALILRHYITTPLTDLDTGMQEIGRVRDLSLRLPLDGDDEIASVKASFNAMLQDLEEKEKAISTRGLQLAEEHRKANLYLDIYLDVLTYEILNVTISLQAYAELLRESEDTTAREYAERITLALNKNLSVIQNIEAMSKIYKNPPTPKAMNLETVVNQVIRKRSGVNVRYSGGATMVAADEMLSVVFQNLLDNAQQFGGTDLQVDITVRDRDPETWEISVSDNGPGIADEMKSLVFDRFVNGSDRRSSYGLGLHIVRTIIEAYGGRIQADDRIAGRPDQGVAIRFTLRKV